MDHFCLRFIRYACDAQRASYRVESFDFNEEDAWEEIARLHVRLAERGYAFEPLARWEKEGILVPTFYLLSSQEQDRQYRDVFGPLRMGLGAYALRVHAFAIRCIESGTLPPFHPPLPADTEPAPVRRLPQPARATLSPLPRRRAAAMDMARASASIAVPVRGAALLAPQDAAMAAAQSKPAPYRKPRAEGLPMDPEGRAIERTAALAKLQATRAQRVVQLCAPAGYGKTILMHQYAAALRGQGVVTRWLTLTEADNDLSRLQHLLEMASAAVQHDASTRDAPAHGPGLAIHPTLFIDQIDALESIALGELCAYVHKARSQPLRFVMAARARFVADYLPAERWSRSVDVSAQELAFSEAETRTLMQQMLDVPPDGALVAQLHAQTQGWPALLRILCRQLRERGAAGAGSQGDTLDSLLPNTAPATNYLMQEIFERVPEALWPLLRDLSVLDPVDTALGERLLGRGDVASGLQALSDAGLPLRKLGSGAYALHPLLLPQLRRLAYRHDPDRFAALGEQAAQWLAAEGRIAAAVDTLLGSGHQQAAVQLIENHAAALLTEASSVQWDHWCRQLSAARVKASPVLCTTYASLLAARGQRASAAQWLAWCEEAARAHGADARWDHTAQWLRLQDLMARGTPAQVQRALPGLKAAVLDAGLAERHRLATLLAEALIATGDYGEAERNIQIAKRIAREERCVTGMAHAHFLEGVSAAARGRMQEALISLKTAHLLVQDARQHTLRTQGLYARISGFFAAMHYERNQLSDAMAWVGLYEHHGAFSAQAADSALLATLVGARVAALQRRTRQAIALLQTRLQQARTAEFPRAACLIEQELARHLAALQAAQATQPVQESSASLLAPHIFTQSAAPAAPAAAWDSEQPRDFCLWPGDEIHGGGLARAQALLAEDRPAEAVALAHTLLATAQQHQRRWREARLRALLSVAHAKLDHAEQAVQEREAALSLGLEMGLLRTFLDDSAFIDQVRARQAGLRRGAAKDPLSTYAASLLAAADSECLIGVQPGNVNFSEQESRVLDLVAGGHPNKQVAAALALSVNTVKWHLARIYVKLGASSRTEAVFLAKKRGFIAHAQQG